MHALYRARSLPQAVRPQSVRAHVTRAQVALRARMPGVDQQSRYQSRRPPALLSSRAA